MSKSSAKANPMNQEAGKHNKGSEPGQEQLPPRLNRRNTGNSGGTRVKAAKQGRQRFSGPRNGG